ncbi:MAG TPA: HD domain-containing phosphohydrolase [Bradyrhizobium sp.]|uniref:HD-GYP domain-containing protein n=1 Tax=Bradyrhizobium sp. TaxID=376 RepID=UPI002D7F9B74|nr:HD domain-containing phosphohydrolase [Bradyrhizobium sp.]HET7889233.1 HD domain-containing phosphohydrolase [Bradyrhizobium sp.]
MLVCYLTDEPGKIPAIRAALEPRYAVVPRVLGQEPIFAPSGVLMVDADLREGERVEQIKNVMRDLDAINEKLFVVHRHLHHLVAQAYALGATGVVHSVKQATSRLTQIEAEIRAAETGLDSPPTWMTDCGKAFAAMYSAIGSGKTIHLADAETVTTQIIASISQNGLNGWLDNVRKYHEGTFQHCLLVTGIAVAFALDIKFTSQDVKRLGIAATLHDIGKARIPLSILDKPGRLNPKEEDIMKQHPLIGYDLLKDIPGISIETLDAVKHHHEYLDGSGYPDALASPQISDLVRLLTISDIFAALIEARPYRAAMPREEAYKILSDMNGKLETSLVKAFRRAALAA